jgi:mono/diheme cytochrome c family protein
MPTRFAAVAGCCFALALGASAQGHDEALPDIEATVRHLAQELSTVCPLADPADQAALEDCRRALFTGSLLRRSLGNILLWGQPHPKSGESLKNTTLTQFAPEAWTGLYAPLFMFDGTWRLDYDEGERLYRAHLGALFRNALDPGQYPYPFWHDARKWNAYQSANTVILWIAPQSGTIVVGQFTNNGHRDSSLKSTAVVRPPFDGQWMWTDATGASQPAPALFRGLFSEENPYLRELEPAYRELANAMRTGHCNACHVPNNPGRMSRLVLLQTPVHAAAEIKRIMRAVRDNEMPVDDTLLYHDIGPDTRAALLDYGGVFEDLIDAARAWEAEHTRPR